MMWIVKKRHSKRLQGAAALFVGSETRKNEAESMTSLILLAVDQVQLVA